MRSLLAGKPGGLFDQFVVVLSSAPEWQIDNHLRVVSRMQLDEAINDAEAEVLWNVAGCRRQTFRSRRGVQQAHGVPTLPLVSPSDRRSNARAKRRTWSGCGALPPEFRCHFTPGENAVAAVIRAEIRCKGKCTLSLDRIARSAGLLGTTVAKRFLRKAKREGLIDVELRPVKGGRSKTNIITIISNRWLKWNEIGEAKGLGGTAVPPIQSPIKQDPKFGTLERRFSRRAALERSQGAKTFPDEREKPPSASLWLSRISNPGA